MDAFFEAGRPFEQGYPNAFFAFVAVRHLGFFTLLQGRLVRNTDSEVVKEHLQTDHVLAGQFAIAELNLSSHEFAQRALLGTIPTPFGELRFPPGEAGRYISQYEPFHQDGLSVQQRLSVLRLDGATVEGYVDILAIGWHLRAADKPYHGLEELLFSFGLAPLRQNLNIELVNLPVTLIDNASSVSGTEAHLGIRLAKTLDRSYVTLGYRVVHQGNVVARASLKGCDLAWEEQPGFQLGGSKINIPETAVVHCFASFNGIAQHFYFLADPSTSQNPRRAVFEVFDPDLSVLSEFLSKQGRGKNARDLEIGVSWLLWMLGFSTANLGGTARTQDFADLIATTPSGHFLVIECTTGLLRADDKLPKLIQRTQLAREHIQSLRHLKVLPVLVTSRPREEVRADLDQAERLGVLVITKEDLDTANQRTLTSNNADSLFSEAEGIIRANLEKHNVINGR